MSFSFLACDRDQDFLLPPCLRDWLPQDHLAWFLIDAVAGIDLSAFLADYREDGWGRPAFDPEVMVTLLLYAYAVGERSSRGIERRCREDVAFRVITANACPDHATIARFRQRHEQALAGVFTEVLRLCAEVGLLSVGLVALDGTKLKANASKDANRSYAHVSHEVECMLREAAAADEAEDARLGAVRGDELPDELAERTSRQARLRQAKAKLEVEAREQRAAYEAHLAERARIERERGRPLRGRKPKPPAEVPAASARVNTTDPDSALVRTRDGFVQGYNAQAIVAEGQLIVAAELSTDSPDGRLLEPMVRAARAELAAIGLEEAPGVVVADAGYWNVPQIERVLCEVSDVLVSPVSAAKEVAVAAGQPRKPRAKRMQGRCLAMHEKLSTPGGRELYARRKQLVEPVFAQTKVARRADRFQRRGFAACRSEWRLIAATHNLLKLWRCQGASRRENDTRPEGPSTTKR
jgi:transposase